MTLFDNGAPADRRLSDDGYTFDVFGIPKPQGSKTAFTAADGHARLRESGGSAFAAWRNAVAQAAHALAAVKPLEGPLRLDIQFRFPMATSGVRKAVRATGWRWKVTAPDTDKLVRTVGDALTASGLILDDKLVVELHAVKIEVADAWTGARITIEAVT